MSTAGGPRLAGIGRSGDSDLMLCLDAHDAASYPGEPVANAMSTITGNIASSWSTGDATWATDTVVNMKTPVGTKANKMWMSKSGNNGFYGSPNVCRLTSSGWTSDSTKQYYYALWITTDQWSQLDNSTYKYVTGSNGWPGISATSYKCTVGGREWRYYKGYISAASNNSSGTEYFTFFKNGTWSQDLNFYTAGTMVHNNGNYAVPFQAGPGASYERDTTDAWKDLSGRGNNGTFTNNLDTGVDNLRDENVIFPVENCYIDFDGTDDSVNVSISNMPVSALNAGGGLTLSAWVKSNNISTTQNIISRNGPYFMRIMSSTLRMGIYTGSWMFQNGSITLSSDTWYNLVITYDQSNAKSYVNGVLDKNIAKTGALLSNASQYLGYTPAVGEQASFDGLMGKISIYKVALTADQVKANFNANRSRFGV